MQLLQMQTIFFFQIYYTHIVLSKNAYVEVNVLYIPISHCSYTIYILNSFPEYSQRQLFNLSVSSCMTCECIFRTEIYT